jgi:chromosome segregation ATPase
LKKTEAEKNHLLKEKKGHIERANDLDTENAECKNKIRQLEKDNAMFNRKNNTLLNEKDRLAKEKLEVQNEKNITRAGVNALTREIEYLRKQSEMGEIKVANLIKDKDKMTENIQKVEKDNEDNKTKLSEANTAIDKLKNKKRDLMK